VVLPAREHHCHVSISLNMKLLGWENHFISISSLIKFRPIPKHEKKNAHMMGRGGRAEETDGGSWASSEEEYLTARHSLKWHGKLILPCYPTLRYNLHQFETACSEGDSILLIGSWTNQLKLAQISSEMNNSQSWSSITEGTECLFISDVLIYDLTS